jgi:acetyl esterase
VAEQSFAQRARVAALRAVLKRTLRTPALRKRFAKKRRGAVDGRVLDEQMAAILGMDDLASMSPLDGLTPAIARAKLVQEVAIVEAEPPSGVAVQDRSIEGAGGRIGVRSYVPSNLANKEPSPAIAYFHGGGWVTCDLDTHDVLCRRLALGAKARVFSFDYRLAPENRWPAAADDATFAARWVIAQASSLGVDPARVAVMGDSAGGNLSAVVSRRLRKEDAKPALAVLLYPALDATFSHASHQSMGKDYFLTRDMIDWYFRHYTGGGVDPKEPDLSPLHADDFAGCPPTLVYVAGFDPLRDEGIAYVDRLREAGVKVALHELAGMPHGYALMTGAVDAAREAVVSMCERIGEALRDPSLI